MKTKYKILTAMLLSAALLVMPMGAFFANEGNALRVYASDGDCEEFETESSTENDNECCTVSGNDVPEPVCICTDKCNAENHNGDCVICEADHSKCEYVLPKVRITITEPKGWYKGGTAEVTIKAVDMVCSGNFEIAKAEVRIGQNGSYMDITDTMSFEITEDCSVYVQITDAKGKVYQKNRSIECFDREKPTLNAGINSGMLSIQASDNISGVKAVYVNGQEFKELTNGAVNIRLQQFDANYENFAIQAMDNAGNLSDVYKTTNPYYIDPEAEEDEENTVPALPENAQPTKVTDAKATVTEHVSTKKSSDEKSETSEEGTDKEDAGKEFYTIQTDNGKVFYLIVDNTKESDNVFFLTEISENDLLNVTGTDYTVMEQNSAVVEAAIPGTDTKVEDKSNIADVNTEGQDTEGTDTEGTGDENANGDTENTEGEPDVPKEANPMGTYIFIGVAAVIAIVALYFFKIYRKKGEDFEDDDEDEEEAEEYENEDEDADSAEDDFFDRSEEE